MKYQYKVVPFMGKLKGGQGAEEVSRQLEAIINTIVGNGWEFYQLADADIEVKSGCLGGLFGSNITYTRYDQLIFRREMN